MAEKTGNLFLRADKGFTDQSGNNHTITNNGIIISTDQTVLNGSSTFKITNNSHYITIPSSGQFTFGTGQFTIDFWLRWGNNGTNFTVIKKSDHNNNYRTWTIRRGNNSRVEFVDGWPTGGLSCTMYTQDNVWRHYAFVRQHTGAGGFKLYVNGVLNASVQENRNFSVTSGLTLFESLSNAYVDNIRVTKGEALWTSNFNLTEDDLFYPPLTFASLNTTYSIGHRGNLRGKAAEGYVRPTIKQFFTSADYEQVASYLEPVGIKSVSSKKQLTLTGTEYSAMCKMSDDSFLWMRKVGAPGIVSLGTIAEDNTITWSNEPSHDSYCQQPNIVKLDDTHFIMTWNQYDDWEGRGAVGEISGSTITLGSTVAFNTRTSTYQQLVRVDDTHVVVLYYDGFYTSLRAHVGTISGTTLTWGASNNIDGRSDNTSMVMLDSNKFLAVYKVHNAEMRAKVCTISGDTITPGTWQNLGNDDLNNCKLVGISSTKAVLFYRDGGVNEIKGRVLTISGNTVTSSSETTVIASDGYPIKAEKLDDTHFSIVTTGDSSQNYAFITELDTDTDTFSSSAASSFSSAVTGNSLASAVISDYKIMAVNTQQPSNYAVGYVVTIDRGQ